MGWLCVCLAALAAYPAVRFVRRAWRFGALPTVIAVVAFQLALLGGLALWALLAPRPDLGGAGWFAVGLAALALPLAVGDAIQSRRWRAPAIALALAIAGVSAAAGVAVAAPTTAATTVAGRTIPVTTQTLAQGYQLTVHIPPTASGFWARDASLFVPPGWIRDPSGTRPVVEMMMGQPGSPTLGATLDALHTLGQARFDEAPFVLVVDQLGGDTHNPPCSDTVGGKLETYLSQDVPAWIGAHLPAAPGRDGRVIAGYSHGGECALYLGAKHPDLWSAVIDIGGPDKPGEHLPVETRDRYYGGSQSRYESVWPATVLAKTAYPEGMTGFFVAGQKDLHFRPQVEAAAAEAERAGWTVTSWTIAGSAHTGPTLTKGLAHAYGRLIPAWTATGAIPASTRFLCTADQSATGCGLLQAAAVGAASAMLDLGALALFLAVQLGLFLARRPSPLHRAPAR